MTPYKKTISLGKVDYTGSGKANNAVEIEVEIDQDGELHMIGNVWQASRRDIETGGQCEDTIAELFPNDPKVQRMVAVWRKWHLNHMKAGTPAQEAYLEAHKNEFPGYPTSHYDWATELLNAAGLNPDNGYKYGTAWLKVELPADIVAEVMSW